MISSPLFYGYGTKDDIFEGATPNGTRSLCSISEWPVSAQKSWPSLQALVTYVLPFIVIVVAHFFIIRKLRKTRRKLKAPETITRTETTTALAGETSTTTSDYAHQLEAKNRIKDAKSANRDLKITKVLIGMTVWFVLCWTPWTVGRILSPFIYAGEYFISYYPW